MKRMPHAFTRLAVVIATLLFSSCALAATGDELAKQFADPPPSSRPWTFWFWVNGNVTKEGIRADLEDMKRVGIGGMMLFDGSLYLPPGPLRYGSDAWHEHVQYAIAVADELGLQIGVMNCAGWATAGGPWNDVEHSMKMLAWNETAIDGGRRVELKLSQPPSRANFYRDVAVLAVPNEAKADVRKVEGKAAFPMSMTFAFAEPTARRAFVIPGIDLPPEAAGGDGSIEAPRITYTGTIEASDDGTTFHTIGKFDENTKDWAMPMHLPFPRTTAKAFRINFAKAPAAPQFTELMLSDSPGLDHVGPKTGLRPMPVDNEPPALGDDGIAADSIVDLTKNLAADGTLTWDAPAGAWTILRIGYTTTATTNHPAVPEGTGYEVDKFDEKAVANHFEKGMGRIIREAGPHAGKSLAAVISDSWEAGPQTWTAAMPELFEQKRGYPMRPYLACLAGRVVNTRTHSDAFLRDFRKTLGDLYAEKYFRTMSTLARQHGMFMISEGYGGVFDEFKVDAEIDVPGVEFWNHNLYKSHGIVPSVAHTTGKPIVMAEAFTSRPPDKSRWIETPAALKVLGDTSYCMGVNRFAIHSYIHQPRSDIAPGFTHGRYGTQFGRLNSWWPIADGWIVYFRRCQLLLQAGSPVADTLYLTAETLRSEERDLNVPWPKGTKGDYLSVAQLGDVTLEDGLLRVNGETRYRTLVLPKRWPASMKVLDQLKKLGSAGAMMIGPSEVYPDGVVDVRQASAFAEATAWLRTLHVPPLLTPRVDLETTEPLQFTHRRGEGFDVYFVSNPTSAKVDTEATFRVTGREPEIWNPVTGDQTSAAEYRIGSDSTRMRLALNPTESTFVVFRNATEVREKTAPPPAAESAVTVEGPWKVEFQPGRGAPASIMLDRLTPLNEHAEPGVKYFSGLATYTCEIDVPAGAKTCKLDLGAMYDIAQVRVNGELVGTAWLPPFVVDLTSHVRPGKNTLAVVVANRWINRLIGDEQLPADAEYNEAGATPGALLKFPAWWNQTSPKRERVAFSVWKHWGAKDALVPAGLVGPVRVITSK